MSTTSLLIVTALLVTATRALDIAFLVNYDTNYGDLFEEEFDQRYCMSVEYPRTDSQIVLYDEYLSIYCTCFGQQFEPICPHWVVSTGRESVYVAQSQVFREGSSCTATMLIGTRLDRIESSRNVSLRCVLPNTEWKIPEFRFRIAGSRFEYLFTIRYHPLLVYGTICWILVLVLYVIQKAFSKRRSKSLKVYSIPEVELIMDKSKGKMGAGSEQLRGPICEVSIKIRQEEMAALCQKHLESTNFKEAL